MNLKFHYVVIMCQIFFYCLELKSKHNCEFSEEELTSRWKHLSEEDRRPYDELFAQAANSAIVQESVSSSVGNLESGNSRKRERVRSSRFLEFEDLDFVDKKKPDEDIFDRLNPSRLNDVLRSLMPHLSAKVSARQL